MSTNNGGLKVLTVELSLQRGVIHRRLSADYLEESSTGPALEEIGRSFQVDGHHGIPALKGVLDGNDETVIDGHLQGPRLVTVGEALFEILFGVKASEEPDFIRKLFGALTPAPTGQPLRVRIVTAEEQLLSLPWGLTAWRRWFLRKSHWTFEVSDEPRPSLYLRLKTPTSLLLLLPERDVPNDELGSRDHEAAVAEVVEAYFRGHATRLDRFAVATTREETVHLLRTMQPSVVYYYGRGVAGPEPGLHMPLVKGAPPSAPTLWPARDVAAAIHNSGAPVQVLYLNGCMSNAGRWGSLGHQLLHAVPVVLTRPTGAGSPSATEIALRWFHRLLGHEDEPIQAAFHRDDDHPPTGLGTLPLLAFTRHATFRVDRELVDFQHIFAGIDLDRIKQRKEAFSDVRELAVRRERRIQGFIAYGEPNNHHEDVPTQIIRHIDRLDPRLELHVKPVDVSTTLHQGRAEEPDFLANMAGYLRTKLDGDWSSDLGDLLALKAPPRTGKRYRILWLDWGVLRGTTAMDDVRGWLDFCSDHLVAHLPSGFDLVVSIAIEAPRDDLEPLFDDLDALVNDTAHRTDQIRFTVLPQLVKVPLGEILQHLDDTGCPQGLRSEIAGGLHEATGGAYGELRRWADSVGRGQWVDLRQRLRADARKKNAGKNP